MGRTAKHFTCTTCGIGIDIIPEDESTQPVTISGKKYCKECAIKHQKDMEDRSELIDYIYQSPYLVNQDDAVIPYIAKQLKELVEDDGFTYKGILLTLIFIYEKTDNGINPMYAPRFTPTIGVKWMVEKYYASARDHFIKERDRMRALKNNYTDAELTRLLNPEPNIIMITEETIRRSDEEAQERIKTRLYGPAIDLNMIVDDEEEY